MSSSPISPLSWNPYDLDVRDCSTRICSIYCSHWCSIFFSPPPPDDEADSGSRTLSPLFIALIGILSGIFLLIVYYFIAFKYCGRSRRFRDRSPSGEDANQANHEAWYVGPSGGLEESVIRSITMCRYKRGDGLVECTECSVCLGEFRDGESLRLLPKCTHAFHVHCIDAWLKSHTSCPLCRCNIANPKRVTRSSSVQTPREQNDAVLVVDELRPEVSLRSAITGHYQRHTAGSSPSSSAVAVIQPVKENDGTVERGDCGIRVDDGCEEVNNTESENATSAG